MDGHVANSAYGNTYMPPHIAVSRFEAVASGFHSQSKFTFGNTDALKWWYDLVHYIPPAPVSTGKVIKEGQLWPRGN